MALIAGVRQAEQWTTGGIVAGIVLAVVIVAVLVWLIWRYLGTSRRSE